MKQIEKTVFISYRRTNASWALAIYQNLTHQGYDVFFDFHGIASGDFEQVILTNIKARAHFLVLLTPSSLERCDDPGDWLRREIETALDTQRNIVPFMLEGFDFSTPSIANHLTGKLATLNHYNALRVPADYFDEAMKRLREQYLNIPLNAVLHPTTAPARKVAKAEQAAASSAAPVRKQELTAQEWFERAINTLDSNEKMRCYTEAIRLNPDYALAYYNRGIKRKDNGDLAGALQDFDEAIRLDPDAAFAYINRGNARRDNGDFAGALQDFDEAVRLSPDDAYAYNRRGSARILIGDHAGALQDFNEAIRLNPNCAAAYAGRGTARWENGGREGALQDYNEAILFYHFDDVLYNNRGFMRSYNGDHAGALQDFNEAIRLNPDNAVAYYNRAQLYETKDNYAAAVADFRKYLDLEGGVRDGDQVETEKRIRRLNKKC